MAFNNVVKAASGCIVIKQTKLALEPYVFSV